MFRDAQAQCPRCQVDLEYQGEVAGCRTCGGVLLSEARLDEMLREMHDQPVAPVFSVRAGHDQIPCPTCNLPLTPVTLEGVAIDRCDREHGVWFDPEELEATLRAAASSEHVAPGGTAPSVRIGFGRAILSGLGGFLKLLGWGAAGVIGSVGVIADPTRHRRRW